MKTYTGLRNLYGTLTNDNSSANLSLGDELTNDETRRLCAERDWEFMQKTATATTTASTQFYNLPFDYDKLISVTITSGTTVYSPRECNTRDLWNRLNQNTGVTSNVPEWFFILDQTIGFYPTPSSSSLTITFTYDKRVVDLNLADYSTGTLAVTNASASVTGSGTTWTSPMAGRVIRVTHTDTAASSGDGFWYEISSVASATALTLTRPYNGTTATGCAYTIGQASQLPEQFQDIPVYKAAEIYFTSIQPERVQAELYRNMYDVMRRRMIEDASNKTVNPALNDNDDDTRRMLSPNLFVML